MPVIEDSSVNILTRFPESQHFRKTAGEKKPFYMGVELESLSKTDDRWTALSYADRDLGHFCIFKAEGCCHFEIVSLPSTLEYHREEWKKYFKGDYMRESGTDCGMHIHLDRKFMSLEEQGRLIVFVNNRVNQEFRDAIGGRTHAWAEGKSVDKIKKGQDDDINYKFQALNVSSRNNRATMELRICKSTYDYENFMRRLEFADAIVHFAQFTTNTKLSYKDFLEWFKTQEKTYPVLFAFLNKQNAEYKELLKAA